ncbi:MAG: protein translocase subunit SecF [Clostridiales bacterium]|nr:protein translocase subunit SecF [Clostridiales bacterium]
MNFNIVKHIRIWIAIPLIIILIGFGVIAVRGFNMGIDFIGGSNIYASIGTSYDVDDVRALVSKQSVDADILSAGQNNQDVIIRLRYVENQQEVHNDIVEALQEKYNLDAEGIKIEFVGPTMGRELIRNAVISVLIAGAFILVYIWIRFELKSGITAVIALLHDVLILIAVTAMTGIQINSSFIAAILTIVGYSINDTIVIFDRVRENRKLLGRKMTMSEIVDQSIRQSITRTLNTSLTTIFAVAALYVLGVESIKDFTLPILIGLMAGTYSSIFVAGPLWAKWDDKPKSRKLARAK